MYNIKVVKPPNVMYLLSEQNITIHPCMTSSAEDNSVILRAGDNRNYPPLRTIEKLYDKWDNNHLSYVCEGDNIFILRGNISSEVYNITEEDKYVIPLTLSRINDLSPPLPTQFICV